MEPSRKARLKLRDGVREVLNHWTTDRSCAETIRRVNRIVQGWGQYFHYGNSTDVFKRQQHWLQQRLRKWLWKKYGRTLGRHTFFTDDRLRGQYGLAILPCYASRNR